MRDLVDIFAWYVSLLGIILGAIPKYGESASKAIDRLVESIKGTVS